MNKQEILKILYLVENFEIIPNYLGKFRELQVILDCIVMLSDIEKFLQK